LIFPDSTDEREHGGQLISSLQCKDSEHLGFEQTVSEVGVPPPPAGSVRVECRGGSNLDSVFPLATLSAELRRCVHHNRQALLLLEHQGSILGIAVVAF